MKIRIAEQFLAYPHAFEEEANVEFVSHPDAAVHLDSFLCRESRDLAGLGFSYRDDRGGSLERFVERLQPVEEVEGLRRHKAELLAVLAPATIASEPIRHLSSHNQQGEKREECGEAHDARIPAGVRAEIQRIEAEALALGWRPERLWNHGFWPHTHLYPRGLASVIESGDSLVEPTPDYIVIEKSDCRKTRQRFWRTDA